MWLTGFIFLTILYLTKRWLHFRRWSHFPGPSRLLSLPILGHTHILAKRQLKDVLKENRAKYGNIYRFDVGSMPTVFLCDYDDICAAYKSSDAFSGKFLTHEQPGAEAVRFVDRHGEVTGISSLSAGHAKWRELKKFTVRTLSDLGFGKRTMEEIIVEETKRRMERLRAQVEENPEVKVSQSFIGTSNAIIWRIVSGREIQDDDVDELVDASRQVFKYFSPDSLLKLLQFNSAWGIKICKWLNVKDNLVDVAERLNCKLASEAEKGVPDESGSFIDRFHAAMQENRDNVDSLFNQDVGMDNLKGSLWDLFIGGTDTSSTFVEWAVLFMIKHPDVQAKMFREVSANVGNRNASLDDRPNLPYVESFIDEVLRCSQLADLGVPHQVVEDTQFAGYLFPRGTQVFADISAVHNDKDYWGDPKTFRPERFLTPEGKFKPDDRVSAFGVGKRRCVGEALGRASIFIMTVALVQNFEIRAVRGDEPSFHPIHSVISYPRPFSAIFKPRF